MIYTEVFRVVDNVPIKNSFHRGNTNFWGACLREDALYLYAS